MDMNSYSNKIQMKTKKSKEETITNIKDDEHIRPKWNLEYR